MITKAEFTRRLRRLIHERGLTPWKVGKLTGIGFTAIYKYVNGTHFPSVKNLMLIHDVLGCEWGDLLGD